MKLSKIEIITGMSKLTGLKSVLSRAGVRGMTVVQVLGCGVEKGTKEYEVDENYEMELLPKQQISIVVKTEKVKEIVELIKQNCIRVILEMVKSLFMILPTSFVSGQETKEKTHSKRKAVDSIWLHNKRKS